MLFRLTPIAKQKVVEFQPTPESNLRLVVKGGGCSGMTYELAWATKPEVNDRIVLDNNITIYIDNKSALFLNGAELDYVESLTNGGFKINSSAFKSVCGCGESFGL